MPDARLTDDFDPLAKETFTSAHEEYSRLRRECPVAHSTAFNGFWSLFRYQDVVDFFRRADLLVSSVQNVVSKVAFTGRRPPLPLRSAGTHSLPPCTQSVLHGIQDAQTRTNGCRQMVIETIANP